jgi:RHS repeat-associated protein
VVDGNHRRVGKKKNGVLEQAWLYDGQLRPIAELDGAGNIVSVFMYGERSNVPEAMTRGGNTYRIVSDHLGSVRLVVDASTGNVAQAMSYAAWGAVLSDSNPGFQPFGFAGGLYDRDLSLVRFGTRDFDPETGRWTCRDAIGFVGGNNLYVYVDNDPVDEVDPSGKLPIPPVVCVGPIPNKGPKCTTATCTCNGTSSDCDAAWKKAFASCLPPGTDPNTLTTTVTTYGKISTPTGTMTTTTTVTFPTPRDKVDNCRDYADQAKNGCINSSCTSWSP